jgi:hypothetical protein
MWTCRSFELAHFELTIYIYVASENIEGRTTSATIIKGKLEVEGLVNKTFSESGFLQIEQSALQKQLEVKRSMLEEKMEWVVLGEALLVDIEVDSLRLDNGIIEVKWEILVLEVEEKII